MLRHRLLALLLSAIVRLPPTHAALLASSRLEQCFNNGVDPLDCAHRMVVSLAIASGQRGTEEIQAVVDRSGSSSATSTAAPERTLEAPLRISLTKTETIVRYPVTYLQTLNAAPREQIIPNLGLGGCEDGDLASNPTCGWVLSSVDGSRIPNSQGFCCNCGFDQMLGFTGSTSTRAAELQCGLFGDAQSAHCLRMNDLWYATYSLGPPQLHFTIIVAVTQANGTLADYTLELGPHAPGATSPDGKVTARLLGDLSAYTGDMRPLGETKYLMVPSAPATHARVLAGAGAWLLVDKTAVTLDGTVCNKIGVSYTAFRQQPSACTSLAGSCLHNQPEDMQLADEQRIARGETPLYRATAIGAWSSYADSRSGAQYVAYRSTTNRNSLVTLTLNADAIRFVIAESDGRIDSVVVADFEAQSSMGRLLCAVTNIGAITADYSLRLSCTAAILGGIEARALSLTPSEQRLVTFVLHAEREEALEHTCTAELFGSRQTLLSSRNVTFRTTDRVDDRGAQDGRLVAGGRADEAAGPELNGCALFCKAIYDLPCLLTFGCWGQLAVWLAVLGGVLLCCACACCFCCCRPLRRCVYRLICSSKSDRDRYSDPPPRSRKVSWASSASDGGRDRRKVANRDSRGTHESQQQQQTRRFSFLPEPPPGTRRRRAYLNVSGDHALAAEEAATDSWLRPAGPEFSLRGEMITFKDEEGRNGGFFRLGAVDSFQHWRWDESRGTHVVKSHPTRLNRAFFRMPLANREGVTLEELGIVTTSPAFVCINSHAPAAEGGVNAERGGRLSVSA